MIWETINGIDLVLFIAFVASFVAWRFERSEYTAAKYRVASGQCWYSECILDAGHRGLHKD